MTKRKARKAKKSKAKQMQPKPMTEALRDEVRDWLYHMNRHIEKAITLSKRMDQSKFDEDDDLFWALVKYVENVQECMLQLDRINHTILLALDEIPQEPSEYIGFSWKGMKGMRQRLAHDFRKIDPEILWQTVSEDFPILISLTSRVRVSEEGSHGGTIEIKFKVGDFRSMPAFDENEGFKPGNSMIGLFFDEKRKAQCVRFARIDDRTIRFETSDDIKMTSLTTRLVDQDGSVEHLGGWPSSNLR